jgi:hypothetical protein
MNDITSPMSDTASAAPSAALPNTGNKHDAKSGSATYLFHTSHHDRAWRPRIVP